MYLKELFIIVGIFYALTTEAQTDMTTADVSSEQVGEEALDSLNARGIVGDIKTIKKVVEVIQTVGEKVIPAIIDSQKSTNDALNKPTRFKLLKALKSENQKDDLAQD